MPAELTRRATARDVAALAGVSVATVSLIANGKSSGRVTPDTEARVRSAIAELDYRVNSTASALAQGRRDTVTFMSPDPGNPYFAVVLDGLASSLDESLTLTVLWARGGDDYDPSAVQRALAGDLAGLVLVNPDADLLDAIAPTCPTILLDSAQTRPGMSSMELDVEAGGIALADHLAGLGHRRVAYLGVDRDKPTFQARRRALRDQLRAHGAGLVADIEVARMTSQASLDGALAALPGLVADGVTAVVCVDDLLAYGVLQAAGHLGISVPGQLSVAGFNDLPFSAMVSLTSVDLSARELGARAGQRLNEMLLGSQPGPTETLRTRVVARESTANARD